MARLIDVTRRLVMDERVRSWCRLRYPGHPNGCPNYNKSEECPPKVNFAQYVFNLSEPHWFVVEQFNLGAHARKMALAHPTWTGRQCRNCLYWQNGVRKKLRQECERLVGTRAEVIYTLIPEAMGVHVFATAERHGLTLVRDPREIVYKIALLGKSYWPINKVKEKTTDER